MHEPDHYEASDEPLDSPSRPSAFFVGVETLPAEPGSQPIHRTLTVGAESDYDIDYVGGKFPRIRISIIRHRLAAYVVATSLFLATFTGVAYHGVTVAQYESKESDSTTHESQVEMYNTISGFVLAAVDVGLGLVMARLMPVYLVYLHNTLWFLDTSTTLTRFSKTLRSTLMVLFPVVLMLLISNSLRSLQAAESTTGFKHVVTRDDLRWKAPPVQNTSENEEYTPIHWLGILKTSVNGTTAPFEILTQSVCSSGKDDGLGLSVNDLDGTNVVYGYRGRDWNVEAVSNLANFIIDDTINRSTARREPQNKFNLTLAYELFMHGKIVLDKGISSTIKDVKLCTEPSPDARCPGMKSTLSGIGTALKTPANLTRASLFDLVGKGLAQLVPDFNASDFDITLKKSAISPQVNLTLMVIEGYSPLTTGRTYTSGKRTYRLFEYGKLTNQLCGSLNCIFVDQNSSTHIPRQIVALPSLTSCSLTGDGIEYSRDLHIYKPRNCTRQRNAFVSVGTMTYIAADKYGSSLSNFTGKPAGEDEGAYLVNPYRVLRLVIARYSWQPQDLAREFDVACSRTRGSCDGLSYQLESSKKLLLVGNDSLPYDIIASAGFESPHRLVQLNQASLYLPTAKRAITPERLLRSDFEERYEWSDFSGPNCSRLIASYMAHVERNNYFFDGSTMAVYRAAFYFLFANGSVVDFKNSSLPTSNATMVTLATAIAFAQFSGDKPLRLIRMSVPFNSYALSIVGCVALAIFALVVLIRPKRRLEYFPRVTSRATQYVSIVNSDRYPDSLHTKTLLFPATNESLPMHDFAVDSLRLSCREFPRRQIVLS